MGAGARARRTNVGPEVFAGDVEIEIPTSGGTSHHELLQPIPPHLATFADSADRNEERGRQIRRSEHGCRCAIVGIAVVEGNGNCEARRVGVAERHNVIVLAKNLALFGKAVWTDCESVRIVFELSDPVIQEHERTGVVHRARSLATRAATIRGNSRSNACSSSPRNSSAAIPYKNATQESTLPYVVTSTGASVTPARSHSKPVFVTRHRSW